MADALEVNLLTFLATCVGIDWGLSDTQQAAITGIVFIGIIAGTLFWGIFADRFGRRSAYFYACFLVSFFGFLSGASPNFLALILFRSITGFGLGAMDIPFDLLAEFLPDETRGKFCTYIMYFWTLGSLMVTGLAWAFLSQGGWRMLTYLTAVPVALVSLFSLLYLPESPHWLLVKGRREEAEQVLRDAAAVNGVTLAPFTLLLEGEDAEHATYAELLQDKGVRQVTLSLWVVWLMFGATYYGLILYVGRLYETHSEAGCSFQYGPIFFNAASEIVGCTLAVLVIDSWGRRTSQSVFYLLSGMAVLTLGLGLSPRSVMAVAMVARFCSKTALSATWVATPELHSTRLRTVGHASCFALSKLGAFASPFLVTSHASNATVGVVLALMNVIGAVACRFLPETGGKASGCLSLSVPASPEASRDGAYSLYQMTSSVLRLYNGYSSLASTYPGHPHGRGRSDTEDAEETTFSALSVRPEGEEVRHYKPKRSPNIS